MKATVCALVFTTNLQIHIVTCCIHLRIHHTSRILYLFHSFSDFVAYIVTTLIFPKNQKQWANFSINVAILFLSFKRATTAPNKQIDSQHYKRLKMKTLTTSIHSHNHAVKSIILKNFKLLQNDSDTSTIFSQPPLISFKRDKNIANFYPWILVHHFGTKIKPKYRKKIKNKKSKNTKVWGNSNLTRART